jgi:hypothetical protein
MSFRNEIDQKERAKVLKNDLRNNNASTFLSHTHNDVGGRFAAISSPVVVGSTPTPQYPAAFLQHDPVPDEPALGVDINEMPPVGEPHELKASKLRHASLGPSFSSAKATPPAHDAKSSSLGASRRGFFFSNF